MTNLIHRWLPWTGSVAAAIWLAATAGFGLSLEGYSQVTHPVAVLGAQGVPHALAFNLLGFILPGGLAAVAMLGLRQHLPAQAGWRGRVGAQLALLSTLGFIALGLLPLDPADLHNTRSSLHATAWMLWWVACVPAGLLLALGLRGQRRWRALARASVAVALAVLMVVLVAVDAMPAGVAQRLGFACWWAWLAWAGWHARPVD